MLRILGLVILVITLSVGIGPYLGLMLDVPSLIIVLGFTLGALLLGGDSLRLMARGIAPASLSAAELLAAAKGWKRTRVYSLGAAAVGTVSGWVIMLKNLDDPAAIGPGMAVTLLSTVFALVLAFVLALPIQAGIERRIPGAADGSVTATAVLATVWTVACGVISFGILLVSLAEPAVTTP